MSTISRRSRRGITLVELMVVMAILGMLTAAVAGGTWTVWQRANVKVSWLSIDQTEQQVLAWSADNRGRLPSTEEGLAAVGGLERPDGRAPSDGWGRGLEYRGPGDSDAVVGFSVGSLGRDGQTGGQGYDADLWSGRPMGE